MRKWIDVKVLLLIVGKNGILCCVCGEIIHWVWLFCEICLRRKNVEVWFDIVIIIISDSGLIFDLRIE
jgi:RNA polymerase subunit RPABC4/transcription elongation factor Spt4